MERSMLPLMQRATNSKAPQRTLQSRVERVVEIRRAEETYRGRAWINGRPLGEVDPRFAHLYETHD